MGRHALLEAPDAPAVTVSQETYPLRDEVSPSEVRTVAEIIAQFRRDQGLGELPPRRSRGDDTGNDSEDVAADAESIVIGPWTTLGEPAPVAAGRESGETVDAHDTVDEHDDDTPAGPTAPDTHGPDTATLRAAAWQAALRPAGTPPTPRRRRAASGSTASAVIASLTAELSATHPGLLDGAPHRRRAEAAAPLRRRGDTATRTAPAGLAASLQPVRVTGGLRAAALRVPALAGGWRVPTRTPLVLAGAVAVSVVVTDQAGLLSTAESAASATAAGEQQELAADVAPDVATQAATQASEGARQARARVSRLERSPLPTTTTPATPGATPAGTGTAVAAAPPPDSVMKPGQTIPGDWVRPSPTGTYNSCFCARWGTMHEGIDFAAPLGSPILAVGDGVVVQAGPASGFGNWVIIQHENGDMTIYGHMRYFFVKVGQHVKAGQEIALVGAEGQSTGPHLHLGVKIGSTTGHDGTYVDPVPWLTARGIDVGTYNVNG